MGRVKHCAYPKCNSDSRYAHKEYVLGVTFVPFPKPKRKPLKSEKWLEWMREVRMEFKVENITRDAYLCSKHFVGKQGPTEEYPDPVHSHITPGNETESSSISDGTLSFDVLLSQNDINGEMQDTSDNSHLTELCLESTRIDCDHIGASHYSAINLNLSSSTVSKLSEGVMLLSDSENRELGSGSMVHLTESNLHSRELHSQTIPPNEVQSLCEATEAEPALMEIEESVVEPPSSCEMEPELFEESLLEHSVETTEKENQSTHTVEAAAVGQPSLKNTFGPFFESTEWQLLQEKHWGSNITHSTLNIFKINYESKCLEITLTINVDFNLSVYAFNIDLSKHNLLKLPNVVSTIEELRFVLNVIMNFKMCNGVKHPELITILNELQKGQYCPFSKVVRDPKCLALSTKKTCFFCLNLKGYASRTKARMKKSQNRKYKTMSKKELIELLKKTKRDEICSRRRMKRWIKKAEKRLTACGEPLPEDDQACIEEILRTSVEKNDDSFVSLFLRTQLKMAKQKDPRGRRWDPAVIKWCLYQYHKSPTAYRSLANSRILQLPSYSTLFRNSSHDSKQLGFSDEILNRMKDEIKPHTLPPAYQYFSILLDEIKTKEDLIYKKDTGDIIGYTHLNDARNKISGLSKENHNEKEVASHILMLMLRGTTSRVKYPFAHFATNRLEADDLNSIVWEAVEKLETIGFKIISVIGDGAATNRKFFSMNTTDEEPHFCSNHYSLDEERPIFFMCDPPHLLKTSRNCVYSSTEDCKVRLMYKNGQNITWKPIRDLYENEQARPSNLKKAHKLSCDHIYLNSYSKMKVKYATQVLSKTVANAIQAEFGETYSETVKLVELLDKWFDIFNASNFQEAHYQRKPNKRPFMSVNDKRIEWLENDFLNYFDEWENDVAERLGKFKPDERKKMLLSRETLSGLRQTTRAMVGILRFLLGKGVRYILTANFNQDPLELEFSRHRQACGSNQDPTVATFGSNRETLYILKKQNLHLHSTASNTTVDKESI